MFSMIIVPPISSPMCIPTAVIIGSEALRKIWRRSVCLWLRPRSRAQVTCRCPATSSMLARSSRALIASDIKAIDTAGRIRCCQSP
ncbi:hypothetical protein D3C81_2038830 [compost metagenome]